MIKIHLKILKIQEQILHKLMKEICLMNLNINHHHNNSKFSKFKKIFHNLL